jgi:hypothetical protein
MRTVLFYVAMVLIVIIIFTRCNGDDGELGKKPPILKMDTTSILGLLRFPSDTVVTFDVIRKVKFDAYKFVGKDSLEVSWYKDSFYIGKRNSVIDSATAAINKVPRFDSVGKPIKYWVDYNIPKELVRSGWENVDSAVAELKRVKL